MKLIVCDLCPPQNHVPAHFHLEFYRIGVRLEKGNAKADRPIDVCQKHYDEIFQAMMGMAAHA